MRQQGRVGIFPRSTWSSFELRGRTSELASHITPHVGPTRTASAASMVGDTTGVLLAPGSHTVLLRKYI
jgi:hypothetical protein